MQRLGEWAARHPLLACALLGAALTLALPPISFVPALFLAISGLLARIDAAGSARRAALCGLAFGLGHHMTGLYWITSAILVEAADFWWAVPLAVPLLAGVLALFIAAPCALAWVAPKGWRRVLVLAGGWVLADLARQFVLTGFPWNPLGSIAEMPGEVGLCFMQPAHALGVGGLTLAVVLLGGLPRLGRRGWLAGAAMVLAWAAWGALLLGAPAPAPALSAVLVQGNVPVTEAEAHYGDNEWANRIFARHLSLTRQGVDAIRADAPERPVLVVWPETASPFWLQETAPARAAIAEAAQGAVTIAGTPRLSGPGIAHNSLLAVLPDGSAGPYYDKFHLVPFGEYFPSWLPIRLGNQGWTPGPGLRTLHIPGLPPVGPLVCYEAVFPGQVAVRGDRPGLLVNLTSDSWFGDSLGPRQHLAAARMRAVEEGLPLLRAANTGISAVIDAHGRVVSKLGLGRSGVLVDAVPGALGQGWFGRFGLVVPFALAILSCAAGLGMQRRRRILLFMV